MALADFFVARCEVLERFCDLKDQLGRIPIMIRSSGFEGRKLGSPGSERCTAKIVSIPQDRTKLEVNAPFQ